MKRIFIFALILFSTLLRVNSVPTQLRKRVTIFEPCPKDPPLSVTRVSPDPVISGQIGNFSVSATLASVITVDFILSIGFHDLSSGTPIQIGQPIALPICTPQGVLECPYPANTRFAVILGGRVSADLPKAYGILVTLENASTTIGCARSFVGGAQPLPATPTAASTPTPKAPPPPPPSPPPASPAPATTASPPPAASPPASPGGSGKGAGGVQDSIVMLVS